MEAGENMVPVDPVGGVRGILLLAARRGLGRLAASF